VRPVGIGGGAGPDSVHARPDPSGYGAGAAAKSEIGQHLVHVVICRKSPRAKVERATPHAGPPHGDRLQEDRSQVALAESAEMGPVLAVTELPRVKVQALDAAAPALQFLEQVRLFDRDSRMYEKSHREAELGGPLNIAPNELLTVGTVLRSRRRGVGVWRRGFHVHGDDDMQPVQGLNAPGLAPAKKGYAGAGRTEAAADAECCQTGTERPFGAVAPAVGVDGRHAGCPQ